MKAMIEVDMPKNCNECKFCKAETTFWGDISESHCIITEQSNVKAILMEIRSSNCPMEEKK